MIETILTDLDRLMPHRRPMRLIDALVDVDADSATTSAVVKESWPMITAGAASPLVLVELAAQSAAALNGFKQRQSPGGRPERMGMLVAIKSAEFHLPGISLHSQIITQVTVQPLLENFRLVTGSARIGDVMAGTVVLQTMLA